MKWLVYVAHLGSRGVGGVAGRAHHVLGERDVGGAARFERDGVSAEVLEHLVHVREPEMLHAALTRLAQGHA